MVRLVRLQSGQHAFRDGLRRHRPRGREHHAGCLRGRLDRDVLGVTCQQEVGRRFHRRTDSWPDWLRSLVLATGSARRAPSCWAASLECWSFSASNCWNGCALTIPSARCRFTASAASGERCRWACLPAASMVQPVRSLRTTPPPLKGLFYGGGTQVLVAQAIGSAIHHGGDICGRHGGHAGGECDGPAARVGGRRELTVSICTSTEFPLIPNTSFQPWVRLAA